MQKRNIKMGLIAILAGAILVGALACGFGNDSDSADTELSRIEQMANDNLVSQKVLDARVSRMEETNKILTDRVAHLEEEKQALTDRVATLESAGPAMASSSGAPVRTGLGAAYDVATPEDRILVNDLLKCVQEKGEAEAATILNLAMLSGINLSESAIWEAIDAGLATVEQIRLIHGLTCLQ